MHKIPCARMFETGVRFDYLLKVINEYKIDGIIYHVLKFCSSNTIKGAEFREKFQAEGVPIQFIESDHTANGFEQIRTRINTFINLLQ